MALKDDIRRRVMQNMGELMPDTDSLNDIMSFDMDSMMNEAHRRVVLAAPLHLLYSVSLIEAGNSEVNEGVVTVTNSGILRVLRFIFLQDNSRKFLNRRISALEFVKPESPLALRQRNKMTRGGLVKPVVVDWEDKLELYSVPEATTKEDLKDVDGVWIFKIGYYPDYNITTWEKDFPVSSFIHRQLLLDAIAWMTTALLFDAMEESGNADVARTRCNELLTL